MESNEEVVNEKTSKFVALLKTVKKILLKPFNKIRRGKAFSSFDEMENNVTFPAASLFLHFFAFCGVIVVIVGICVILYASSCESTNRWLQEQIN